MEKASVTQSETATLVFGAAKQDSGRFVNYGVGNIYWCKIWYRDLGEDNCRRLASWTHEKIDLEVSGFYRYALYDDYTKESMMSLLASNLLDRPKSWNDTNTSVGGWEKSALNKFLNTRFYDAIPSQIKSLIKKVSVSSTVGNKSSEIATSGCYVAIPSIYDLDNKLNSPYRSEVYCGETINFMTGNDSRKRAYVDGDYKDYWTRSPNVGYASYVYQIDSEGKANGFVTPSSKAGVLIELSF
jgi:hypothetical protein